MGFTCCIMYMQNILEQFFKTKKLFYFCTIVWSNKLFFSPKQGFARKSYFLARMTVYVLHRIITARKEKGWRWHFFHQIEPNWPLPYSIMPVPRLREARPAGWVTYCSICAIGWVNFLELEITVCGSRKMSRKINWLFLILIFIFLFCKNP